MRLRQETEENARALPRAQAPLGSEATLLDRTHQHLRRYRGLRVAAVLSCLLATLPALAAMPWSGDLTELLGWRGIVIALVLLFSLSTAVTLMRATVRERALARSSAAALGAAGPQHLGPLIESIRWDDFARDTTDLEILCEQLERLRASDADCLSAGHRTILRRTLALAIENPLTKDFRNAFQPARPEEVRLRLAILRAIEQVGDEHDLTVVTGLAAGVALTANQRRIREAARDCLPALRARVEAARPGTRLLRPAPAEHDTLVRPAAGAPAEAETLVRPVETAVDREKARDTQKGR